MLAQDWKSCLWMLVFFCCCFSIVVFVIFCFQHFLTLLRFAMFYHEPVGLARWQFWVLG